jgi:hypothetical protein
MNRYPIRIHPLVVVFGALICLGLAVQQGVVSVEKIKRNWPRIF